MGAEAPADPATAAAAAAVEVATTGAASAKGRTTHATESERAIETINLVTWTPSGFTTDMTTTTPAVGAGIRAAETMTSIRNKEAQGAQRFGWRISITS